MPPLGNFCIAAGFENGSSLPPRSLATVVGVLVEVPAMLSLVAFANRTRAQFT